MLLADATTAEFPELSVIHYGKSLTIKDAMFMVAAACNDITVSNIQASWKKLLSHEQSAAQSIPCEDSDVCDMLQTFSNIEGCEDCDEAAIQEWLQVDANDQGYPMLNDKEIVQIIKQAEHDRETTKQIC